MKNNIFINFIVVLAILWASISVLYLFAGLLILLHSEEGIIWLLKTGGNVELIAAIAAIISAIAAVMAYLASDKAAEAATRSNIIASLPDRIKTRDALSVIWNYLNSKSCIHAYDPSNPTNFLVSSEEIDLINNQKEIIYCSSLSYGEAFHNKVVDFYTYLQSELSAQQNPCDDDQQGSQTLLPATQAKYKNYRVLQREKAFNLLREAAYLLHRQP